MIRKASMALSKWASVAARKGKLDVITSVAYDGLGTSGYQLQPALKAKADSTIEARIVAALRNATGEIPSLTAVSRTDADVSAKCQLIRFSLFEPTLARFIEDASSLAKALNDAAAAAGHPLQFNRLRFCGPSQVQLRHCVTWKQYSYFAISAAAEKEAQQRLRATAPRRMLILAGALDVAAMQRALKHLLGTHNFGLLGLERQLSPSNFRGKRAVHMRKALADASAAAASAGAGDDDGSNDCSSPPDSKRPARDVSSGAAATATSGHGADGAVESRSGADESESDADSNDDDASSAFDGEPAAGAAASAAGCSAALPHKDKALRRALLAAVTTVRTLDVAELTLVPLHEVNLDLTEAVTLEQPEVDFSVETSASEAGSAEVTSAEVMSAAAAAAPHVDAAAVREAAARYGRPGGPGSGGKPLYALRFRFGGDGFLRHQVRLMVGIALAVGKGALPEDVFKRVLEAADGEARAAAAAAAAASAATAAGGTDAGIGSSAYHPSVRAMAVTAAADAAAAAVAADTSAAAAGASGAAGAGGAGSAAAPASLSAPERLRAVLGVKSVPKAGGCGLLLERVRVPAELWGDDGFTNNTSPAFLADSGLALHTVTKMRRTYDLIGRGAAAGAGAGARGAAAAAAAATDVSAASGGATSAGAGAAP